MCSISCCCRSARVKSQSPTRDGMIGLQDCGPVPPKVPPSGGRTRERTAQAVEYYNNHIQKARVNAGLTTIRSSYNDHHNPHNTAPRRYNNLSPEVLSRSNSSLELLDHHTKQSDIQSPANLKREYGSHGSINVIGDRPQPISGTNDSFFEMLKGYHPTVGSVGTDQRSPGPSEYLKGKVDSNSCCDYFQD
ncbi:hypothetical protein AMK59_3824, partial [Oryctes borbonicus]